LNDGEHFKIISLIHGTIPGFCEAMALLESNIFCFRVEFEGDMASPSGTWRVVFVKREGILKVFEGIPVLPEY